MIQPNELKLHLPMTVGNDVVSTTTKVWEILLASKAGDSATVKKMVEDCPELAYAQYNYAPPIHFAVREGHTELVKWLLDRGAHDPDYKLYPFQEDLQTVASDRGFTEIENLLNEYAHDTGRQQFRGDNGRIWYNRNELQNEFEKAVDENDLVRTEQILNEHPAFALDETYFWSEGILTMPAKENHRHMIDLLLRFGARVPAILKWTQFYYFERLDGATYMMEKGMNPNTMSWQHVTILHDMAQKGYIDKAALLLQYGAGVNAVDEQYQSTPLGMAARWGHKDMVQWLLDQGANPNMSGTSWSTPLAWAKRKKNEEITDILKAAGAVG